MRQKMSALFAAVAVMTAGAAPAMACGWGGCCGGYVGACATAVYAPVYTYAPSYAYTGCGGCGWAYELLAEPTHQYYYVNQGPTFSGPGAFAPYPVYEESAVAVYNWRHYYHRPRHYHHHAYPLRRYY